MPTPSSLQLDLREKLRQLIERESAYLGQNPQEMFLFKEVPAQAQAQLQAEPSTVPPNRISQLPFQDIDFISVSAGISSMLQSTPAANLTLSQLQRAHHSNHSHSSPLLSAYGSIIFLLCW